MLDVGAVVDDHTFEGSVVVRSLVTSARCCNPETCIFNNRIENQKSLLPHKPASEQT